MAVQPDRRARLFQVAGSIAVALLIVALTIAVVTARLDEGMTGEERRAREERLEERQELREERQELREDRRG